MPIDNQNPQIPEAENHPIFEFKNQSLLLPEHTATDPATDFLTYGTSDEDLQF